MGATKNNDNTEFWDEFLGRSNFEVERGRNFQDGETGSVIVGWKLNQNYFVLLFLLLGF